MTSSPLIRLVSRDAMTALVEAFLDDLAVANRSPQTLRFYRDNLGRYRRWCVDAGVPLDPELHTKGHVRDFLRYVQTTEARWDQPKHNMAGRRARATTVDAYFRALRRWYNWLVQDEVLERSPMATITRPKVVIEQPDPFSDDELALLSLQLREGGDGMLNDRNRAIVAVLLDLGLRGSEIAQVCYEHMDLISGDLIVMAGKGGKSRPLRLGARARKQVRRYWLRHRRRYGESGQLFLTMHGDPMNRDGIHDVTTKLGKAAGVDPCNPHRFRHTFAITALRAGMRELELQAMLGHTSLEMVRRYAKLAETDIIRASKEHSPLDHLKLRL